MGLILRAKKAAAALAMLALTAIGGQALAQNVVVEGNSRVDTETVRSYVSGSGSPEEARRSLLQTG